MLASTDPAPHAPGADVIDWTATAHALRESRERLQAALDASDTGTFRWDIRTSALDWDENLDRLFGLPPGHSARTLDTFIALVHEDDRDAVRAMCDRCATAGGDFRMEYRVVWPDGSIHWLDDRARSFPDEEGRPHYMTGACVDITSRKTAEQRVLESEARFRRLSDANLIGIAFWRESGEFVDANDEFLRILGYTRSELDAGAVRWTHMTPPEYVEMTQAAMGDLRKTGVSRPREKEYYRKDGSRVPVLVAGAVTEDHDGQLCGTAMILDLTEPKRAEATVRDADRRKDEFLAMLGHELRNPLGPVRNAIAVINDAAGDDPRVARAAAIAQRQVSHMGRLVDDLLDVSRIARGAIELKRQRLDVNAIVAQAVEDYEPIFTDRRVRIETNFLEDEVWVEGDPVRIAQAITNVLHNASKFTPQGGSVHVSIAADSTNVRIAVTDSGPGIDGTLLPQLFTPFLKGSRTAEGGLGLGLAVVKGLVELHGGQVHAANVGDGSGATIAITLPRSERGAADAPAPAFERMRHAVSVLIVEDNPDAAESMRMLVEMIGHRPLVAHTGISAIELARDARPDVILCDIGLPGGMTGYAVARAIRAEPTLGQVFLVALTGYGQTDDRRKAHDAGFDIHITKPVDIDHLEALLAAVSRRLSVGEA